MTSTAKSCIIHIGMHKTGSSSLQATLKGYYDSATHYANLGIANHSMPLVTLFKARPENYGIHKQWGRTPQQISEMKTDFAAKLDETIAATQQRMILSGEGLSARLDPLEVAHLAEHLRKFFDRIQVIAYVRDFASFAPSSFQEKVKTGKDFFEVPPARYRKRFRGWVEAIAPEDITFVPYTGATVDDFFERYSLDRSLSRSSTQNVSLSAPALALLFAFNQSIGKARTVEPRVQRALRRGGIVGWGDVSDRAIQPGAGHDLAGEPGPGCIGRACEMLHPALGPA